MGPLGALRPRRCLAPFEVRQRPVGAGRAPLPVRVPSADHTRPPLFTGHGPRGIDWRSGRGGRQRWSVSGAHCRPDRNGLGWTEMGQSPHRGTAEVLCGCAGVAVAGYRLRGVGVSEPRGVGTVPLSIKPGAAASRVVTILATVRLWSGFMAPIRAVHSGGDENERRPANRARPSRTEEAARLPACRSAAAAARSRPRRERAGPLSRHSAAAAAASIDKNGSR